MNSSAHLDAKLAPSYLSLGSATRSAFQKAFTFSGRASRSEYWWAYLGIYLINTALSFVSSVFFMLALLLGGLTTDQQTTLPTFEPASTSALVASLVFGLISALIYLFGLLASLVLVALMVRRLHDLGRSGWWYGAVVLGTAVFLVAAIALAVLGANSTIAVLLGTVALVIFIIGNVTLFVFMLLRGNPDANKYGPGYQQADADYAASFALAPIPTPYGGPGTVPSAPTQPAYHPAQPTPGAPALDPSAPAPTGQYPPVLPDSAAPSRNSAWDPPTA